MDSLQDEDGCARIIDLQIMGDSDVQSGLQLFGPSQAASAASPQVSSDPACNDCPGCVSIWQRPLQLSSRHYQQQIENAFGHIQALV